MQMGQPAEQMVEIVAKGQFAGEEQLEEHVELTIGPVVDFEVPVVVEVGDAAILGVPGHENVLFASPRAVWTRKMRFQESRVP